ncbi:GNAT family N-acetyltransferase [Paenibacillus sp. GSMTC-2017]|uniref:GNAT family N-acetyltransferase n=1 Tax=Paenibacillus sp. GSMTC-2017 TaxID=2794350 RepID=UPI0018D6752C|nr:GNAT family N-acetyltransferase [Paenibacillus sp. GSMTC-2017]MBH5316207.1 GNAT family N-acetyltransferase [Paenibacillus sp. GSMTC-2017]
MNIEVRLTDKDEAYIIKNLYPLYLHDLSGHHGTFPNTHGIFEDSNSFTTLTDQYDIQNVWWEKPGCLYPFLILVDGIPAGFDLIATHPHCSNETDYFVNDFFLLQPFRGKGVAENAAIQVFEKFKGKWELFTNPSEKNIAGQKFWRRTISIYTKNNFHESSGATFDGDKLIFRFSNN